MGTFFNTAKDSEPIIAEIQKQMKSFEKALDRKPTRLYIGMEEYKSLIRESHLWTIGTDKKGASIALLFGLVSFQVKIPEHIHVSFNKKDIV